MGSFASHDEVSVSLDKSRYSAGDTVKGYVKIRASQTSVSDVFVKLHGEVRTLVRVEEMREVPAHEGEGTAHRVERTSREFSDHERVVEERRLVARFPNSLVEKGDYCFPFEFLLHSTLPSSCAVSCEEGQDYGALLYSVEVHLLKPSSFAPEIVHRTYFDVLAGVPDTVIPAWTENYQDGTCCFCLSHGSINLSARLVKDAFTSTDPIILECQVSNQTPENVSGVDISIYEDRILTAESRGEIKTVLLATVAMPAIPPGMGFGQWDGTSPRIAEVHIPPTGHCSMSARCMKLRHYVQVQATTARGNGPTVELPLTLHRSPLVDPAQNVRPHSAEMGIVGSPSHDYDLNPLKVSTIALKYEATEAVAPTFGIFNAPSMEVMAARRQGDASMQEPLIAA